MSINREKLSRQFGEEYKRLNEQQKLAVDTLEGPVMVIAGPGTGKTQILAARIGKILLETDVFPDNILCLTYTDAGALAMRRRLLSFIGPDAYKVSIHTFHSFCNDIIQDNLSLFEKTSLDPISDLEKIQLFKTLIDGFPKDHPLKRYRGDVYFEINNLQHLFSTMKREGWTEGFIKGKIDEYIADLPSRDGYTAKRATKEFKKGDLRTDKIAEEAEKMNKLRAAIGEFDRFQELMRKRNRYDFDDMINWVIRAFEENKSLLAHYQERYQYVLVDEYQDTSGTQNRLVSLLISYWEHPNVFVVGDDDQSIYRFQGANVENMLEFAHSYKKDLLTVVLTHNYRSIQPILDVSKAVIDRNEDRLVRQLPDLSKDLQSARASFKDLSYPPLIREFSNPREEMAGITLEIEELVGKGVPPGRIAVIYKENKYGEELSKFLQLKKIPVYSKRSRNLFGIPFAEKILLLLRWLAAEHDTPYAGDEMLFEILHFDFFGIPPMEVARLSVEASEQKPGEERMSLRRLLYEKGRRGPRDLFDQGPLPALKKAGNSLEKLVGDVPNTTLQGLFENLIRDAGILATIMKSPDKILLMQILTALFDFIKEESHRDPSLDLQGLVQIIDLMEDNAISIPLVEVAGSEKAVNLLTAHGSKGLEFEWVFLAGCHAGDWEKKRKPGSGYKYPDTMFQEPSAPNRSSKAADDEELRRLFYVALTRAEQRLILSYPHFRNDGKELEPSMFLAEILEKHVLPVDKIRLAPEVLADFEALSFTEAVAPEIEKMEEAFISRMLDKFVMNVTALNNFLRCPLEFYFKNLIRIPSPRNEATEFGSAIHFALQRLFEKMKAHAEEKFPSQAEMLEDFEWHMRRHRESFTREAFARRMEYGVQVLKDYYQKYIGHWNKIVAVERNIRNVVVKGVPLKGKLDKLEFNGKEVTVVDYKTGDLEKAKDKLAAPGNKQPEGGDYWRQAVFYKILVDHYEQKDWKVIDTEFDFVEPDKKKEYRKVKIPIGQDDMIKVTGQITEAWQKIQNREFYTGCGKADCHWCNFVKTNDLAIALHAIHEEEDAEI